MKNNIFRLYNMDETGYTERQAERNRYLILEILSEIRSIKKQLDLIRKELKEKEEKWEKIPSRPKTNSIDKAVSGSWFGY